MALEGVFVQIGLLPNTEWLKGTVQLSPRGEIEVDARGETIVIAMGEGSKASLSAFDYLIRLPVEEPAKESVAA